MTRKTSQSFVYLPLLRWEPLEIKGSRGHAWIKTLAKDEATGARTALVKFDPGFRQEKAVSSWPVDSYVIEGEMRSGDRRYQKDTYHYRPAGLPFGPVETSEGITRLIFTADSPSQSSKEEVFIQDVKQMSYGPSYADKTGKRLGVKELRKDRLAKVSVLIHSAWVPGERTMVDEGHVHDHIEEAFLLAGEYEDYLGDLDTHLYCKEGVYVCRVPGASFHGDSTIHKTPTIALIRRGWVADDITSYYDTMNKHSPNTPIQPIRFAE